MELVDHFASSCIILPTMSEEELAYEFHLMVQRNLAAKDFVDGLITADEYEDVLNESGVDPISFGTQVIESLEADTRWTTLVI